MQICTVGSGFSIPDFGEQMNETRCEAAGLPDQEVSLEFIMCTSDSLLGIKIEDVLQSGTWPGPRTYPLASWAIIP